MNKSLEGRNIRVTVRSGPQINILRRSASPQGGRIKLSYFRHGSVSPPRITNANYNGNSTTSSKVRCIRRQNSLVIQRTTPITTTNHSYDMNFKCQQNTPPPPPPLPTLPTRLVMDIHTSGITNARLKNNQYERSMKHTALTPNTNGSIAIMIGASNSTTTSNRIVSDNNDNKKWLNRDSSSTLSNSNPVSPIVRIGEQGLYDLGISVDRNSVSLSPSQTDNQSTGLNFSALPRLSATSIIQPIVRCPVSPVAISVSSSGSATLFLTGNNCGTISLYQKSNNNNEQITQQVSPTSGNVHVNSRRPPLPRFESNCNKKGGYSVVRISALHNLRPTTTTPTKLSPSVRNRSELLRPSGSYDNLLCNGAVRRCSLTEQSFQRPKLRCFSVLTNTSSSNPSQRFFHSSSDHYVNAMPNAQSMGIEDIKLNCSPQARLSTPTMINETSEQGNHDLRMLLNSRTPRNNSVSSMRQNMTPGGNKITTSNTSDQLRNIRSSVSGNNPNYFRIQIPSTRAISRPKGFAMTDSLKLYEEQIFSHCQPHQRPQSWCLDFDQPRDEHNPVDDSHSSSPASTVSSSFSSSSSSDTSQLLSSHNHADLRRIKNPPYYTPPIQPRNSPRFYHQISPIVTSASQYMASEATTPTSAEPSSGCRLTEFEKEIRSRSNSSSSSSGSSQQRCRNGNTSAAAMTTTTTSSSSHRHMSTNAVLMKATDHPIILSSSNSTAAIQHYRTPQKSSPNHHSGGSMCSNSQSESIQTNSSYDTVRPVHVSPARLQSHFLFNRSNQSMEANVGDEKHAMHNQYLRHHHSCEDENSSQSITEFRKLSLNDEPSSFEGNHNNNNTNFEGHSSPSRLTPSPLVFSSSISDRSDNNSCSTSAAPGGAAIPPSLSDNHREAIISPFVTASTTNSSNNSDTGIGNGKTKEGEADGDDDGNEREEGKLHRSEDALQRRSISPTDDDGDDDGNSFLLPPPVPWNLDVSSEMLNETTPSLFVNDRHDIIMKSNHRCKEHRAVKFDDHLAGGGGDVSPHYCQHFCNPVNNSHLHQSRGQNKDLCQLDNSNNNNICCLNGVCNNTNNAQHHNQHRHMDHSPELSPLHQFNFDSIGLSDVSDSNTYAFSTLDSEYLAWMRLSVRDVTNHHRFTEHVDSSGSAALDLPDLETLSRPCVHHWVDIFNSNPLGLRLNFVDDSCRLAGTLRIYINLIKPVKMSLRRTLDMLPSSETASPEPNSPSKGGNCNNENANDFAPTPPRLVSFFLPRGTSKVVYVTSSTTSANAIQSLLDRFHIQESARKFALYEHTLEGNTISARKLSTSECPLLLLLNWVRTTSSRDHFLELLKQKRIVLQENDACDIEWKEFTTAELTNFLRILDKEESEYRNAILYQYNLLRNQLEQRMKQMLETGEAYHHHHHHHHQSHHQHHHGGNENSVVSDDSLTSDTNGGPPVYSRFYSPSHPYALEQQQQQQQTNEDCQPQSTGQPCYDCHCSSR